MQYLQACILEGLRIHPPLAQLRDRVTPPEGDYIHGYRIPPGTSIGFNSWGTQRDAVYGDDPNVFRPERWLENDEIKVQSMRRTCDLVFGCGPTKCLGSNIAAMVLNKVIFESAAQPIKTNRQTALPTRQGSKDVAPAAPTNTDVAHG
ncbi:MAG: hypothetical protein Q9182_000299 [Xanthomendoza sp. 2 TL-2023]